MLALLTRMSDRLPAPLQRRATPERLALLAQFLSFGCVGTIGFLMDVTTVYALKGWLGLYGAGMVAYVVASTGNWAINRAWTFRGKHRESAHVQWARFMVFNLFGLVLNRGAYILLVTFSAFCAEYPVYAVAAGAIAGMGVNFILSRNLVFRRG